MGNKHFLLIRFCRKGEVVLPLFYYVIKIVTLALRSLPKFNDKKVKLKFYYVVSVLTAK